MLTHQQTYERHSMHYKIASDIVIKTENAAKPESQRSAYLEALMASLPHVSSSLDYGCGKLRYRHPILERTDTLALVDSEIQLSRQQVLRGVKTSIREIATRSNRIAAYNDLEFRDLKGYFDRAFCINVLSVVPIFAKRLEIMDVILSHLRSTGACLFVVQYRNSDFTRMARMPNARLWRDGFLMDSLRGYSFYGLISPDRLISMARKVGYLIHDVRLNEGSVYLWASRGKRC